MIIISNACTLNTLRMSINDRHKWCLHHEHLKMSENDASKIVIDDYTVMLKIMASLTGNSRRVIYNNTGHKSTAIKLFKIV